MLNSLFGQAAARPNPGAPAFAGGRHKIDFRSDRDNPQYFNQYDLNTSLAKQGNIQKVTGLDAGQQTHFHYTQPPATIIQYAADAQGRAQSKYDVVGPNNWQSWLDTETADYMSAVTDANVDTILKNESLAGTAPDPYRITTTSRNYLVANDLANYYIDRKGVMQRPPGNVQAVQEQGQPTVAVAGPVQVVPAQGGPSLRVRVIGSP